MEERIEFLEKAVEELVDEIIELKRSSNSCLCIPFEYRQLCCSEYGNCKKCKSQYYKVVRQDMLNKYGIDKNKSR